MADLITKFNDGGLTSDDINRQFRPEYVNKIIVEQPDRQKLFSKHANYMGMVENNGDTLTRIVNFPMLNKGNLSDANLDAATAKILKNEYKIIDDATQKVVSSFSAEFYIVKADLDTAYQIVDDKERALAVEVVYDAGRVAAKAAAVAAVGVGQSVWSSAGAIIGGEPSYGLTSGNLVPLPETGGVVNLLNSVDKLVSAKVSKFGVGHKYTVTSLKQGSIVRTIAQKVKSVSKAVGELKELQIMTSIISAAAANALLASDDISTTHMSQLTFADVVDYSTFEALEQELHKNDVPMDTELHSGSMNVDTHVVEGTFIMYIGRELLPMVRKIVGPDGNIAFRHKASYVKELGRKLLDGEQGSIGAFTICVSNDLLAFRGAGVEVGGAADIAYGYADDAAYNADTDNKLTAARERLRSISTEINGVAHYDVFPMVVVGDDSFVTTGFDYNTVSAKHIPPAADVYNDMHAEVGGVSAKWSYGFLAYRPERLRMIQTVARR